MPQQETSTSKKRRGPAPKGAVPVLVRLPKAQAAALDAWIAAQPKPVSRPEAIRAMVAAALTVMSPADDAPGGEHRHDNL